MKIRKNAKATVQVRVTIAAAHLPEGKAEIDIQVPLTNVIGTPQVIWTDVLTTTEFSKLINKTISTAVEDFNENNKVWSSK